MIRVRAPGSVEDLVFSDDSNWLGIAGDGKVWRLSVNGLGSPEPLPEIQKPDFAFGVKSLPSPATAMITSNVGLGPEPDTVLFGNYAGSVEIWNAKSGKILRRFTFR